MQAGPGPDSAPGRGDRSDPRGDVLAFLVRRNEARRFRHGIWLSPSSPRSSVRWRSSRPAGWLQAGDDSPGRRPSRTGRIASSRRSCPPSQIALIPTPCGNRIRLPAGAAPRHVHPAEQVTLAPMEGRVGELPSPAPADRRTDPGAIPALADRTKLSWPVKLGRVGLTLWAFGVLVSSGRAFSAVSVLMRMLRRSAQGHQFEERSTRRGSTLGSAWIGIACRRSQSHPGCRARWRWG